MISGNELLVNALKKENVDIMFAYPGACNIDLLDELYKQDDIDVILPRHEQALVHEADAYARSTGKPGVCLVTSGPGATNMVTGIATANYDSVPLVCFTGQVATGLIGNDAFQEVDIVGITRSITKHSVVVTNRKDLGRIIKEAFYIATTGRPGPVLIDLPKNVMNEMGEDEYPREASIRSYKPNTEVHMGQIKRAFTLMKHAERPLFLVGGGIHISNAQRQFTELVEKSNIPVITTIMGKGAIPTNHKLYIGNIGMHGRYAANHAVSECDLLISIGTRFNDRITGKLSEFAKDAKIIHIDIDTAAISRNIQVDIPIVGDAKDGIIKLLRHDFNKLPDYTEWNNRIASWKEEYPITMKKETNDTLSPQDILETINQQYSDLIVVTDVGQHQMWTSQYIELDFNKRLLTSGGLGTMGYGIPGAIGAKLGNPDKKVICISGDGGAQMNIQEMATAVTQELPVTIVILNNGYLGMVRQWQDLFYDKRYSLTCLKYRKSCKMNCLDKEKTCPPYSPDFVALAKSYGAEGIRVFSADEFLDALKQSDQIKDRPVIIECIIDDKYLVYPMVKPGSTLSDMIIG